MQKKYLGLMLVILVITVLFILGCEGGGEKHPITSVEIYTGIDGIAANFFNLPDNVFEGKPFRVSLELENKGAYPEYEDEFIGYIALGIEDDYMEVKNWRKDNWIDGGLIIDTKEVKIAKFQLKGKTIENPLGGKGILGVDVHAKAIRDVQSEKHDTDVLMSICYKYQTKSAPTVCIDTTQYSFKEKEKSCVVQDITLNSQGAPVAVTKVETQMLPYADKDGVEPMFLVYIENKGNGEVINIGDKKTGKIANAEEVIKKACSAEPFTDEEEEACSTESSTNPEVIEKCSTKPFNYVVVNAKLSEEELQCSPNNGLIRLKDKQGMVRCTLESGISQKKGTYTTPLQITVDYGYMFTVSKKVTVKRMLKY